MSKAPGLETGTQLVIDSSCVPLAAPLGMVSPELPPRWTTTEPERVGELRPPEAARKMSMLPQNSMSPELYPRTRRTLPELIAHPSQFAPRISSDPLAFPSSDSFAFPLRSWLGHPESAGLPGKSILR